MTDSNYTAIAVVMDRSGSMSSIAREAENSLNAFISEQKGVPGRATLTFVRFDDRHETVYDLADLNSVDKLVLEPRGMTALNDAFGSTIKSLGQKFAEMSEDNRPGKVLFVVVTDGQENASREYTSVQVRDMVLHQQEEYGWDFVFIGANQDAVLTGQNYGISAGSSITFKGTTAGVTNVTGALNNYTTNYRSYGSAQFADADRVAAMED